MPPRRRQVTYSSRPNHAARRIHAQGDRQFRTYDTSFIRPRRSKAPVVVTVIILLAIVAAAAFFLTRSCAPEGNADLLAPGNQAVIVVEQGESAKEIGQTLAEARLVRSAAEFTDMVSAQNLASALIPGTYVFEGGSSLEVILHALTTGPSATGVNVTIPEGFTRAAIADAVEKGTSGRVTAQQVLDASADASAWASEFSFLSSAGTNSLEGFLFPKTYTITAADDAKAVVRMMLKQFQVETQELSFAYPQNAGLDLYGAVKLASIVEKEAGAENRATVASVFYNRLASDRPYLESDATTAYEVGHDPTPDEVHADTPYSTYSNAGLPPTPICSPSIECLKAVCSPDETDYLFFYFAPDESGQMQYYFSRTYEEHQSTFS